MEEIFLLRHIEFIQKATYSNKVFYTCELIYQAYQNKHSFNFKQSE